MLEKTVVILYGILKCKCWLVAAVRLFYSFFLDVYIGFAEIPSFEDCAEWKADETTGSAPLEGHRGPRSRTLDTTAWVEGGGREGQED